MKLLLKLLGLFAVMAIVIASCKKTSIFDEQGNLEANSDFNAANIKTWYYKTFENSADAVQTDNKIKKYPVWKNGIYYKLSTFEVFEFPLIKSRKETTIPSSLSQADKKRVAESSLTRIRFIKDKTGKITVVEVNYIPEIQFLRNNNYDISNVAMGKENSDFTGRMILKKWNGELISKFIFKNGKGNIIKSKNNLIVARGNASSSSSGNCLPGQEELCNLIEECDVYPDGLWTNCHDLEPECECFGIPDDPSDPCEGLSDEACACLQLGSCGGGDPPQDEDEPDLSIVNFENIFAVKISGSTGSNEDWSLTTSSTVTGMKFNNPQNNFFGTHTEISYYPTNNLPAQGGFDGWPSSSVYCTNSGIVTIEGSFLENNKKYKNISLGTVYYPNYKDNNGLPAPFYVPYSNTKFALASVIL